MKYKCMHISGYPGNIYVSEYPYSHGFCGEYIYIEVARCIFQLLYAEVSYYLQHTSARRIQQTGVERFKLTCLLCCFVVIYMHSMQVGISKTNLCELYSNDASHISVARP